MHDFSTLLRRLMDESGVSAAELGRRLGHTNNALVSQVLSRDRTIPQNAIEEWADKLYLEGDIRSEFIVAANMSHSPAFIRELYRQIRVSLRERDAAVNDLKRDNDRLFRLLEQCDRDKADLSRRLQAALISQPPSSSAS